ncbi:hypothetical protein GCM10010123_08360 [Pilimelia anulata]|uniref:DUF4360 domain-containing protein n=1 Tax=Pilimelia anulata TaxID=53371 RepID=A0A8J3B127_9ACTN|nr:DUF4360 domain-containing protein [Pilimelia anulata]GGJ80763.1 hypothetical protein GCM10010123_08360 [Pilimelia anulata]
MKTYVSRLLAGALVAACVGAGVAVPAAAARSAGPPQLELAGLSGAGCPNDGTTHVEINPAGSGFTILYGAFEVRTPTTPAVKACTVTFKVKLDPGYRLGVRKVDYRGEAVLVARGSAEFKAKYFWQGVSRTEELPGWKRTGPYDSSWQATHTLTEFWGSRCGGTDQLVITQNLKATGTGTNVVNMETADSRYSTIWELDTKPCTTRA